jgi:hypothetical protein
VFDSLRGEDSTGVADVSLKGDINIVKELGPPQVLWGWGDTTVFDSKGIQKNPTKVLMGHNRAATQGDVTAENAHPFEFDALVGAHNGTLDDWTIRDFAEYKEHDVDSHVLYNVMNNKGVDEMYKNISGAMALTWYDKETGDLHFLRNIQRPLFYAYDKTGTAIIWASEMVFLVGACVRAGLELHEDGVQSVPVDTLLTFSPTSISCVKAEDRDLEKKTIGTRTYMNGGLWANNPRVPVGTNNSGSSWKKGTRKVGKDKAKNVKLRLGHMFFEGTTAICRATIVKSGEVVNIHFGDVYDRSAVRDFADIMALDNRICETKCRMRVKTVAAINTYHIFHSGITLPPRRMGLITVDTPVKPEVTPSVVRAKVESKVIPTEMKPAFRTEKISHSLFDRRAKPFKHCCPACGNPVSWETMDDLVWLSYIKFVCKDCSEDSFKIDAVMQL